MIRSIIVDAELKSRESLKNLIEDFCKGVSVNALCRNSAEATKAINQFNPDVVFLDIQLQRETGFNLLTRLRDFDFEVIFTTSYSEFAIKAFQLSAFEYLLKPIDINALKQVLVKVDRRLNNNIAERLKQLMYNLRTGGSQNYKLALPTEDGLVFVKINHILYCEASSNSTEIIMEDNRKYVVSSTLKEYEDLLAEQNFFRIHHSYLINLNGIKKYVHGDDYVVMSNDKSLDVSNQEKEGFLSRLGTRN
jgi:two-component system LytT family response regulator